MNNFNLGLGGLTPIPVLGQWIFVVLLWSLFWKGLALWHSAQRKEPVWFVIILIVNTIGILEIIYLFAIAKLKFKELFSNKR